MSKIEIDLFKHRLSYFKAFQYANYGLIKASETMPLTIFFKFIS